MTAPPKIPLVEPPKCPHCTALLPNLEKYSWGGTPGDPFQIVCVLCPHCRKVLQFWVFPTQKAAAPGEPEKSPLWKPS
jgi:hypothetical protein